MPTFFLLHISVARWEINPAANDVFYLTKLPPSPSENVHVIRFYCL